VNQTVKIRLHGVDIEVDIEDVVVTHDPGVWRTANGDGTPPSSEVTYSYDRATVLQVVVEALHEADQTLGMTPEEASKLIETLIEGAVNAADWEAWQREAEDEPPGFDDNDKDL
jgi:hypothetical protein